MESWQERSERFIASHRLLSNAGHDSGLFESVLGPIDDLATADVLDAYRACEPADATQLRLMLSDRRHRVFVKLLAFASQYVPDALLDDFLRAGVETDNPSFNKHFLFPITIVYGRRRVLGSLLQLVSNSPGQERQKVESALYWLSLPREETYWPHDTTSHSRISPDEPITDLLDRIGALLDEQRGLCIRAR